MSDEAPWLTERELGSVLAGLRLLQSAAFVASPINDIATGGGEFEPLDAAEIDDLCERINC